jgi:hypothetical protein
MLAMSRKHELKGRLVHLKVRFADFFDSYASNRPTRSMMSSWLSSTPTGNIR